MNHDKNDHDLPHKESSMGVAGTVVEFMPSDPRCSDGLLPHLQSRK